MRKPKLLPNIRNIWLFRCGIEQKLSKKSHSKALKEKIFHQLHKKSRSNKAKRNLPANHSFCTFMNLNFKIL